MPSSTGALRILELLRSVGNDEDKLCRKCILFAYFNIAFSRVVSSGNCLASYMLGMAKHLYENYLHCMRSFIIVRDFSGSSSILSKTFHHLLAPLSSHKFLSCCALLLAPHKPQNYSSTQHILCQWSEQQTSPAEEQNERFLISLPSFREPICPVPRAFLICAVETHAPLVRTFGKRDRQLFSKNVAFFENNWRLCFHTKGSCSLA